MSYYVPLEKRVALYLNNWSIDSGEEDKKYEEFTDRQQMD